MERNCTRRARALLTAMACTAAALCAGRLGAQEARSDAADRLRTAIDAEAARLRAALDADEAGRDWSEFLAHKTTVDAAMVPLHLLRDAMEAVRPGTPDPDLLRSLRTEWREGPVRAAWSHADGAAFARRALAAWTPAPATEAGGAGTVRMEIRTGSAAWVGAEAPPLIQWTVEGAWSGGGAIVHARQWWRVPLVEPVRVDFPLSGDGFDLWWTPNGARFQDDRGNAHAEEWAAQPAFDNPPEIYAAFDALRVTRARDGACDAPGAADDADHAADPAGPVDTCIRTRTVRRADGSLLRTERWNWEHGRLRTIAVEQEPLRLVHRSERSYEVVTEAEGAELSRTAHRPTSEVVHFPHGCTWTLFFRDPDPTRDAADPASTDATVPDRWELTVDGALRAWADFRSVRVGVAGEPDPAVAATAARLRMEGAAHATFARDLDGAIAARSEDGVERAAAAVAARLDDIGAPPPHRAAEWELVAGTLVDAGLEGTAERLLAGRWLPLVDHAQAVAATQRWMADGRTARAAALARAGGVETEATAVAGAGAPSEGPQAGTGIPAAPCNPARLSDGARRLHDEVHAAITRAVKDKDFAARLSSALCRACADAVEELRPLSAERAASIGVDARAALMAGMAAPDSDGTAAADAAAERFAAQALQAARTPAIAETRIAAMRSAWDRCARAATASLRSSVKSAREAVGPGNDDPPEDESVPAPGDASSEAKLVGAEAHRLLRVHRTLVGNAFVPALDAPEGIEPPTSTAIKAWLGTSVTAAVARERRRTDVVAGVLGGPLAEARATSARRRIAEATVAAATQAYLRWCATPPADGPTA